MAGQPDIYGYKRNPKPQGTFSSEDTILTFASSSGDDGLAQTAAGLLVQGWNLTYSQQLQEIFELGSHNIYWVKGRPQGAGRITRIVGPPRGPGQSSRILPEEAYDICAGGVAVNLKAGGQLCGVQNEQNTTTNVNTAIILKMDGLVVTNVGFSTNVNDTRINEALDFRFTFLDIEEGDAAAEIAA